MGGEGSPEEIWDLISFIRHLPQLTPEEIKQMKELDGEGKEDASDQREEAADKKTGEKTTSDSEPAKLHKDKPSAKPHKHSH